MKDQFVPYELSLKLKELGFDKECFDYYSANISTTTSMAEECNIEFGSYEYTLENYNLTDGVSRPLWQQAFDWFREKHNLFSTIAISGVHDYQIYIHDLNNRNKLYFKSIEEGYFAKIIKFCYENQNTIYEEARQACLEKLIELCKK